MAQSFLVRLLQCGFSSPSSSVWSLAIKRLFGNANSGTQSLVHAVYYSTTELHSLAPSFLCLHGIWEIIITLKLLREHEITRRLFAYRWQSSASSHSQWLPWLVLYSCFFTVAVVLLFSLWPNTVNKQFIKNRYILAHSSRVNVFMVGSHSSRN